MEGLRILYRAKRERDTKGMGEREKEGKLENWRQKEQLSKQERMIFEAERFSAMKFFT